MRKGLSAAGAAGVLLCAMVLPATAGVITASGAVVINTGSVTFTTAGIAPGNGPLTASVQPSMPTGGAAATPVASITSPLSAAPIRMTPSTPSSSDADANSGPGQKWGDPLNTGLYDSDDMHAGVNAYYSAGASGSNQGGVIFSLTIRE